MKLILPKTFKVSTLISSPAENPVVVDGEALTLGSGTVILLYQTLMKSGVEPSDDGATCFTYEVSGEAENWCRRLLGAADPCDRGIAIGWWCDFLVLVDEKGVPEKRGEDFVTAGFCATCTRKPLPPFLYSIVSADACSGIEKAKVLEDYIWLSNSGSRPRR